MNHLLSSKIGCGLASNIAGISMSVRSAAFTGVSRLIHGAFGSVVTGSPILRGQRSVFAGSLAGFGSGEIIAGNEEIPILQRRSSGGNVDGTAVPTSSRTTLFKNRGSGNSGLCFFSGSWIHIHGVSGFFPVSIFAGGSWPYVTIPTDPRPSTSGSTESDRPGDEESDHSGGSGGGGDGSVPTDEYVDITGTDDDLPNHDEDMTDSSSSEEEINADDGSSESSSGGSETDNGSEEEDDAGAGGSDEPPSESEEESEEEDAADFADDGAPGDDA